MSSNNKKALSTRLFGEAVLLPQFYRESDGEPVLLQGEKGLFVESKGSATEKVQMLPTNKTTIGTGTVRPVDSYKNLRIEVWGTGTFTVQIQGIGDSGTPRNLPVWDIANKTFVTGNNITTAGFYEVDIQGFTSVIANASAISGGYVNASGVKIA